MGTDAEVFVPHGVQPDGGALQLAFQLFELDVDVQFDVVVDAEPVAELTQVVDAPLVVGVATRAQQHQTDARLAC